MSLLVWFCLFCSPATGAFATCICIISCGYFLFVVQSLPVVASGIIAQVYVYIITSMWLSSVCGSMLTCGSQGGDTATGITLNFYIFRVQKIYQWVHYSKSHQYFFIIFYKKKNMVKLHVNAWILKKCIKISSWLLVFGVFFIHYICIKAANIYLNKQH